MKIVKKSAVILSLALFGLSLSSSVEATNVNVTENSVRKMICGDVMWSCGATGYICGWEAQGLIDRYFEADPC